MCESGGFRVWGIGLVGVELGLMFYEGECVGMERVNLIFYAELTWSKQWGIEGVLGVINVLCL